MANLENIKEEVKRLTGKKHVTDAEAEEIAFRARNKPLREAVASYYPYLTLKDDK